MIPANLVSDLHSAIRNHPKGQQQSELGPTIGIHAGGGRGEREREREREREEEEEGGGGGGGGGGGAIVVGKVRQNTRTRRARWHDRT